MARKRSRRARHTANKKSGPSAAALRFAAWVAWLKAQPEKSSQEDVGKRIGLTQAGVSMIIAGKFKRPNAEVLIAIERESKDWPEGQITVGEWFGKPAMQGAQGDAA